MTIKRLNEEQVVCDCTGNTSDTYQDRLLVGVSEIAGKLVIQVFCPECDDARRFTIESRLALDGTALS